MSADHTSTHGQPPPVQMTSDERACLMRAMWTRRDKIHEELLYTDMRLQSGHQPAAEAMRILQQELDMISICMRKLWIVYGEPTNGNYKDA